MTEASQPVATASQPRTALPSRPLSRGREESAATSSSRPSPDGEKQRRPLKSGSRSPSATSAAEPSTKGAGTKKKQQPASSSGHSQQLWNDRNAAMEKIPARCYHMQRLWSLSESQKLGATNESEEASKGSLCRTI
ncbi:GATA factor SREP [Akanthomyces lecanii RCEF 1005]|uniref:GATA factor SREP n=1 Tax=Akanthomyces lecanii RCEF 1005 TaxID=1081108 RepID=A0A168JZX9_CORDF|nr:GATA factor SREP [Akanthomyces lecanii RCEF 1005]